MLDSERTGERGNGGHKNSTITVVQVYSECPSLWGSKLNERAQANICQTSAETLIDSSTVRAVSMWKRPSESCRSTPVLDSLQSQ